MKKSILISMIAILLIVSISSTSRATLIDKQFVDDVRFKIIDLLWWLRYGGCWPWCDDGGIDINGGTQFPPDAIHGGWDDNDNGWC